MGCYHALLAIHEPSSAALRTLMLGSLTLARVFFVLKARDNGRKMLAMGCSERQRTKPLVGQTIYGSPWNGRQKALLQYAATDSVARYHGLWLILLPNRVVTPTSAIASVRFTTSLSSVAHVRGLQASPANARKGVLRCNINLCEPK